MECPNCGLPSPDGALRCDCGYDFGKKSDIKPCSHPPPRVDIGKTLNIEPYSQRSLGVEIGATQDTQPCSQPTTGADIYEIREALKGFSERRAGGVTALILSILLFASTGLLRQNLMSVLIIVLVIFLHELGHAVGMRLFGYRNVHVLFIPFMGALTSGSPKNPSATHKAIVSLSGPLPGLILGVACWTLFFATKVDFYSQLGQAFLFLNLFNLLPFRPLDGERFFEHLLFSRSPKVETAFKIVSTTLLGMVAFLLRSPLLGLLTVLGLISLKGEHLNAVLAQQFRKALPTREMIPDEEIPSAFIASVKQQLEPKLANRYRTPKNIARCVSDIWQRAHDKAPSWKAAAGLLAVYGVSILLAASASLLFAALNVIRVQTVKKIETVTRDGKPERQELIYEQGTLLRRTSLSGNLYHGLAEIYYADTGSIMVRGYWRNGQWDGEWSYYDRQGQPYAVEKFERGAFVSEKRLTNNGWIARPFESLPRGMQARLTSQYGKQEGPTDSVLRIRAPVPPVDRSGLSASLIFRAGSRASPRPLGDTGTSPSKSQTKTGTP